MRCAVVNEDNVVENVIVAELDDPAPVGCVLIEITDRCNPGWIWDGTTFIDPNPPEEAVSPPIEGVTDGP